MKTIIYILVLMFCSQSLHAQNKRMSREQFQAHQEQFITEKAGLSEQEARKFFKLYFELQNKKNQYNREAWKKIRHAQQDNLSEAEYAEIAESILQARITCDKLDLEYLSKYKKFLSAKQICRIQQAEMKFHKELLKPQPPVRRK